MAIADVVGKVFGTQLLEGIEQLTPVMPLMQNRSSEVSEYGDGVDIPVVQDLVSVADYHASNNITYGSLAPNKVTLALDKRKYIAFQLEDIDRAQVRFDLWNAAIRETAVQFSKQLSTDFRAVLASIDYTADSGARAWTPEIGETPDATQRKLIVETLYDIVDAYRIAGYEGRPYVLAHPALYRQLVTYITEDVGVAVGSMQTTGFMDGAIGALMGADIIPDYGATSPTTVVGQASYVGLRGRSVCYAQQVRNVEQMRADGRFASQWRSLVTYGMLAQDSKSVHRILPAVVPSG